MKILNAEQVRAWDQYTMQHEPVSSIDLMERAATRCFDWLEENGWLVQSFAIFCGKGNNGGDGLAIARMLSERGCKVSVYILEFGHKGTDDFQTNLARLHQYPAVDIHFIQDENNFHSLPKDAVIIDALFGSGLSRPLDGITAKLVDHINNSKCAIIAIDIPSGMSVDHSSKGNPIVKADHTLSFQCYKPAFMVAENAFFIGEVVILDIGLLPGYLSTVEVDSALIDFEMIRSIYKPRNRFAHKGNFGHALMIAGSYGKIGAAVLSSKACLRSGAGLLTSFIPKCGYEILQISLPEAMVLTDENEKILAQLPADIEKYSVIGIGPGIGTADETQKLITFLIRRCKKPLIIDADGLNCLSMQKEWLHQLPPHSILTPHPKEFDRLFGKHQNDFDRIEAAAQRAKDLNIVIVLKSHHTLIATPSGNLFFNSTGNAGMATGGSGDVLTGIISALVAQNYSSEHAAILGVYLHGLAGDFAANALSQESMIASDIITFLSQAFLQLN